MRSRLARKGCPGVLAIALAALLCACGTAEAPAPPQTLRLALDVWPGFFPATIAERDGLMAEEGVRLDIRMERDFGSLIADFAGDRHDLIAASLGDAITLSRSRPDVIVLIVTNESSGADVLLKRRDLQIDRSGDQTLRLGTNLGGFGELFMRTWLDREGIDPRRVAWANVDASDVAAALASDTIDVGHTWQPYAKAAIESGAEVVFTSAETPGLILDTVLTTRKTLARHPEAIQGFVRAWFRASDRWDTDRDAGTRVVAEALQRHPDTLTLDGVTLYTLADNHRVMAGGANAPLASLIRRYSDFFVERGSLSRPPDAVAMFDPSLLPPDTGTAPSP